MSSTSSSSSSTTPPPATAPIPTPPAPLYPDVPWWAVLITAFVFALVGVLLGVYGMQGMSTPSGPSLSGSSIIVDTISYMPHILLLFGVLGDMFTLDGVWSIPSLIGILSIFANYVFQYFWKGIDELAATAKNTYDKGAGTASVETQTQGGKRQKGGELFKGYTGCDVQGFKTFASDYAPQTLVVTATVFSYYCYDLVRNRGWINSIAAIVAFIGAYAGQIAVIDFQTSDTGGCNGKGGSAVAGGLRALFEGLLFGGVGYGIVQTYAPTRLPSSTISPFPRRSLADLSPGPDGNMYDANGYQYVCLPNGQCVPDMSNPTQQAAFGQSANSSTGTTTPLGGDCPGVAARCPAAA
jgi:hypothetical protein